MDRMALVLLLTWAGLAAGCAPETARPSATPSEAMEAEAAVAASPEEAAQAAPVWQDVEGTSMRYLLSLPEDWAPGGTWPVMVVVTGSNSNFPVIAKGYHGARGEMPLILVTPATVSSGSQIIAERYPHLAPEELARLAGADKAGKLAYDVDGVERALADVRRRFGGERKVYLSGFSMGGTLAWHMALAHGDRMHLVFPVCAVFASDPATVLPPGVEPPAPDVPVFAFQGKDDGMRAGLDQAWERASAYAAERGLTNVRRSVTWRKHSWHHEEILCVAYGHWLGRQ